MYVINIHYVFLLLPDRGDAIRKPKEVTASACPIDFSISSRPKRSTRTTGKRAAKKPKYSRNNIYNLDTKK